MHATPVYPIFNRYSVLQPDDVARNDFLDSEINVSGGGDDEGSRGRGVAVLSAGGSRDAADGGVSSTRKRFRGKRAGKRKGTNRNLRIGFINICGH
jgi:hypothetical protein